MANTKKLITGKDVKEILAEKNGLTNREKFEILIRNRYLSDVKKEIKIAVENKNK